MNFYSTSMFAVVDTAYPDLFIGGISIYTMPLWIDPLPEGDVYGYNNINEETTTLPTDFVERLAELRARGAYAFMFDLYIRVDDEYYPYVGAEFWDYDLYPEDYDDNRMITEQANVKRQTLTKK